MTKSLKNALGGLFIAGVLYGFAEGVWLTWGSRGWVASSNGRLFESVLCGVWVAFLFGLPLLFLADGRRKRWSGTGGVASAFLVFLLLEACLYILIPDTQSTGKRFFQNPVWLLVPGVVLLAVVWRGVPRSARFCGVSVLVLMLPLLRFDGGPASAPEVSKNRQLTRMPNVLVVTVSGLRPDRIGVYGSSDAKTPAIDGLAEVGIRFEEAFAQIGLTGPSHLGLFSGTGPWRHKHLEDLHPIPKSVRVLPEFLLDAGYATSAFVSSDGLDRVWGFDRGFQSFDNAHAATTEEAPLWVRFLQRIKPEDPPELEGTRGAQKAVDRALTWVQAHKEGRPWMMWVNLQGGFSGQEKSGVPGENFARIPAAYDAAVSEVDAQLQRLLDELDSQGMVQDTLVVVVGDHGVTLGEGGSWLENGNDLYPASTHVPLVVSWPGQLVKGRVAKGPVEVNDVLPTVLDLLRLPTPEGIDGISLMGTWITAHKREHARGLALDSEANGLVAEGGLDLATKRRIVSIRTADMLYIHREADSSEDEVYALDDLTNNRFEQVQSDPFGAKIVSFLREQAAGLMEESEEGFEQSNVPLSPAAKARFRALGYTD